MATQTQREDLLIQERKQPNEPENLPCPRCESTNTKFCYYNNYNLSQPRYFCKSCRRYWTRGGTLRNVPVGGGSRKNSKRRSSRSTTSSCSNSSTSSSSTTTLVGPTVINPPSLPNAMFGKVGKISEEMISNKWEDEMELNINEGGSFTSLLTTNNTNNSNNNNNSNNACGYGLGLGIGYGLGLSNYDELGFGLGASMNVGQQTVEGENGGNDTWQFDSGEAMEGGGGCFGWPDLAI